MYFNMKSVDTQINEIDKLTAVSNTMVLLVEMSVSERKEVLPYIQTIHPDFKKHYGSSVITTEGLVDKMVEIASKTATFIKELIAKILKAIYKVLTFWKKDEDSAKHPPVIPTVSESDKNFEKIKQLEQELIAHCKQSSIDPSIIESRLRVCSDIEAHLISVIRYTEANPTHVYVHTKDTVSSEVGKVLSNHNTNIGVSLVEHSLKIKSIKDVDGIRNSGSHVTNTTDVLTHMKHELPIAIGVRIKCKQFVKHIQSVMQDLEKKTETLTQKINAKQGGTNNKRKAFDANTVTLRTIRLLTTYYAQLLHVTNDITAYNIYDRDRMAIVTKIHELAEKATTPQS